MKVGSMLAVLTAFALTACGNTSDNRASTKPAELARAIDSIGQVVPQLELVERMRIDGAREEFSGIVPFALRTPDGHLLVPDWWRFQLRFYDRSGKLTGVLGTRGSGPGELQAAGGGRLGPRASFTAGIVGDSIWVYDQLARRLSFFAFNRRYLGTGQLPQASRLLTTDGKSVGALNFEPRSISPDGAMYGDLTLPDPADARRTYTALAHVASTSGPVRILSAPPSVRAAKMLRPQVPAADVFLRPLFAAGDKYDVSPDGSRAVVARHDVERGRFVVTLFGPTGDTIWTKERPLPGAPVDRNQANQQIDRIIAGLRVAKADAGPLFAARDIQDAERWLRTSIPATSPGITAIALGMDSSIWLSLGPPRLDSVANRIFDGELTAVGDLRTKGGDGVMLIRVRDRVWKTLYNADGVASIVEYDIRRRASR